MKKGFTLIELLAVIVILAVIAVIAVPIVIDIIDDSKKNASLRSAEMYMKALEIEIANKGLNNQKYEDGIYSIDEFEVEVKGELPTSGFVQIKNGEIEKYSLTISDKQVESIENSSSKEESKTKEKYSVWDGESKTEIIPDENGDYHITKASDLAWLAQSVNAGNSYEGVNFYLENNIDLNNKDWTPIGNKDNKFNGMFHGNNYIIKNMYINNEAIRQGLFGDIDGLVEDLIIKDSTVIAQRTIGILTGASAVNAIIDNITIFNSIVKSSNTNAGGIAGQFQGTASNLKVINTNIEAMQTVGGIIGKTISTGTDTRFLTNCYLDSNTRVYAQGIYNETVDNEIGYVGGIVGVGNELIIKDSIVYATIESPSSRVGGIAGQIHKNSIIQNTKMYGKVKAKKYVGGIAGYSNIATISDCEVFGTINSEETSTFGALVGKGESSKLNNNIISSNLNNMQITEESLIGSDSVDTILENNLIK